MNLTMHLNLDHLLLLCIFQRNRLLAVNSYVSSFLFLGAGPDVEMLSGSLDGVSYVNRPAYITCFQTSGTPLSQTGYATRKHPNADEN